MVNVKIKLLVLLFALSNISAVPRYYHTDFTMTIYLTNKTDKTKEIFLEKGRVLELPAKNSSHFQSIILTEGYGMIEIPPGRTVTKTIKGVCLNKGLKYPVADELIQITPFKGDANLLQAGSDQSAVHAITAIPNENIAIITSKGYSDENKDGRAKDREEAFKNAVENAAKESGFTFSSTTELNNLKIVSINQKVTIEEKSIRMNKIVHEEYDDKKGEYLFIGEFEVTSKPSAPIIR